MDQAIKDILEKKVAHLRYWDHDPGNDLFQVIHLRPKPGQIITVAERQTIIAYVRGMMPTAKEVSESMPGGENFSISISLPPDSPKAQDQLRILRDEFKKTS
jgi:hypothetical protein